MIRFLPAPAVAEVAATLVLPTGESEGLDDAVARPTALFKL